MNENDICRKVFDHHEVLKGKLSQSLLELSKKHSLKKEVIQDLARTFNAEVDSSSDKMVTDYQKTAASQK